MFTVMSLVAGCSLLNGVIMGADCRVTFRTGKSETHRDTVQKLLALNATTVIGFVGDVLVASRLLQSILTRGKDKRQDAVTYAQWLPRLLRYEFAGISRKQPVSFMVGGVVRGRPNIVERAKGVSIVNHIAFGNPQVKRNWMPGVMIEFLKAQTPYVAISDAPTGILYVLDSPSFVPRHYRPLDYAAIGSGKGVIEHIDGVHDMILAAEPGNMHVESMWFTIPMEGFVQTTDIPSVGGMFTLMRIGNEGVVPMTRQTGEIPNGPFYELGFDNGRWVQKNLTTGHEIKLLLPWELDVRETREHVFEDSRFKKRSGEKRA
jgi:hypothetical protein